MMIFSIIILIISFILFYTAHNIKIEKTKQQQQYQQSIKQLEEKRNLLQTKTQRLSNQYQTEQKIFNKLKETEDAIKTSIFQLQEKEKNLKDELDKNLFQKKQTLDGLYENIKNDSANAFSFYEKALDEHYELVEKEYENKLKKITVQKEQVEKDLDQIKKTYEAVAAAKLREQEDNTKLSFYKIQLTDKQLADIIKLTNIQPQLNDPSIVSKTIWTSYIMKPTNQMCKRILKTSSPVCGIYKITNKQTDEMYIGQSVNVADRWKNHIKCGLGIDASLTNTLYNNMQKTGVWNFTFELLETCSRDKLNEKQRFWIQMYSSNKIGLNMTKGNK